MPAELPSCAERKFIIGMADPLEDDLDVAALAYVVDGGACVSGGAIR
jgi:hypothetical protein